MPVIPSASQVLDVIGEIRVSLLTDEQLQNSEVIRLWFSGRLRSFLPYASGMFLRCLSSTNLTCQSYQEMWVFVRIAAEQAQQHASSVVHSSHFEFQDFRGFLQLIFLNLIWTSFRSRIFRVIFINKKKTVSEWSVELLKKDAKVGRVKVKTRFAE